MSDQTPAAFISYCRVDQDFALRLAQDLKAAGAAVWLDQLDIRPGKPWDNAVEDALRAATKMLVILTPVSVASENVRDEIAYALKQGKIVIPVIYMDCEIPLRLERKQHIDFRADYARGLKQLLHELRVDNPNPVVLEKAAEGDAQRELAWQARDAETQRLRQLEGRSLHESPRDEGARVNLGETILRPREAESRRRPIWKGLAGGILAVLLISGPFIWRKNTTPQPKPAVNSIASTFEPSPQPPVKSSPADHSSVATLPAPASADAITSAPSITRPSKSANAQPTSGLVPTEPIVGSKPDFTALTKQGVALSKSHRNAEAIPLLSQACDGGISEACLELGDIYNFEDGEPKQAYPLYSRACEGKLPLGCRRLGALYLDDADSVNAIAAFRKGCDGGDSHACMLGGGIYEHGGNGIGESTYRARQMYEKACSLGNAEGCDAGRKIQID